MNVQAVRSSFCFCVEAGCISLPLPKGVVSPLLCSTGGYASLPKNSCWALFRESPATRICAQLDRGQLREAG